MPELPDIIVYIEALEKRILGQTLEGVRIVSPFLLRTVTPPVSGAAGKKVTRLRRLGKRICIGLEGGLWLVLHLMIAGRLHWRARRAKISPPRGLRALDPGGIEVLGSDASRFAAVLLSANHTLKRALTDPRLFSGIGNAYSDEILFEARLSTLVITQMLSVAEF